MSGRRPREARHWARRAAWTCWRGEYEHALADCERALATDPGYQKALITKAEAFYGLEEYDRCLATLDLVTEPGLAAEIHIIKSKALWDLGCPKAARLSANIACALSEGGAPSVVVAAQLASYKTLGSEISIDARMAKLEQIIADAPSSAPAAAERAVMMLRNANYSEGWKEYSARWNSPLKKFISDFDAIERFAGVVVVIRAEQGYGDSIQFCRYAKFLADAGANVKLEAYPALERLFRTLDERIEIVEIGWKARGPCFEVRLMDLPAMMSANFASVPAWLSYLRAEPAEVAAWAQQLGPVSLPRVGLVWAGGTRPGLGRELPAAKGRNIPLAALERLAKIEVVLYSLQKGALAKSELAAIHSTKPKWPIVDVTDRLRNFADTAALIANIDLVIAVDTSTAHLAGALGKPVWLLNRFEGCWRWLERREDSPWYPTMRIFNQHARGDWAGVIDRVSEALQNFVKTIPCGSSEQTIQLACNEQCSSRTEDDTPTGGAELFRRTAQQPGGQAERIRYFEKNLPGLKELKNWRASLAGVATDGTVIFNNDGQVRVLAIRRDGGVFTGSWQQEVTSATKHGETTLTCDWASAGWKQW